MTFNKAIEINIDGLNHKLSLFTHGNDELVSSYIIKDRIWEAFETQLFVENINKGDCVLDIGANLGYYSCIASLLVGTSGEVLSFEPESTNFSLLQKNIAHNKLHNIETFHAGLGEYDHENKLFINEKNRGDHRGFSENLNSGFEIINILKGDSLCPTHVDFIKIDTQGYELQILKGLRHCLENNQSHLKMIVEFWPYAIEKNGNSAEDLINELAKYQFRVDIIDHIHHKLVESDWLTLTRMVKESLTPEKQGFINLWLSPE